MTSRDRSPSPPSSTPPCAPLYIGLMSGTSMDGVDAVLAAIAPASAPPPAHSPLSPPSANSSAPAPLAPAAEPVLRVLAHVGLPLPDALRQELMRLNQPGDDELHRAALAANALARLYAQASHDVMRQAQVRPADVRAIGAHGQTVRHRPGAHGGRLGKDDDTTGYTLQLNNPALLAELTGVDVVADFRSRDVAAGGQGAPLVPAFHQRLFARATRDIAVLNLGGIANLTLLPATHDATPPAASTVCGFDTGPANALLDHWVQSHRQQPYDADGAWAASGTAHSGLLADLLGEPYFDQPPPKSTGRDLFHAGWLQRFLERHPGLPPQDVQATLLELTAQSIAQALARHLPRCQQLLVCGGGAFNKQLMRRLAHHLTRLGMSACVAGTQTQGIPPMQVEAAAFAWLASLALRREPGNLPSATGAAGPRVLGAIYPA